ncbi:MAG: gluconeogenesis factor YvcK family protein [archaeon]
MRKVVVIGGGSGSYLVLKGLKEYPLQIYSIVSMFDSGGSTGKLRDQLGVLPPGDVRRCLIALADDDHENILRELFMFRFEGGVENHSLGNLILTAAEQNYGNLAEGIKKLSQVLNLKGTVLPVSLDNAQLCAQLADGTVIKGETNIDIPEGERAKIEKVFLEPPAKLNSEAAEAIREADLIVIGPGDLYTSLIPNMLVEGIQEALAESKAKIAYVCNLMTKKGETDGFRVSDFVNEIENYLPRPVDHIICNENHISRMSLERYRLNNQFPVVFDMAEDQRAIVAELIDQPDVVRHNLRKLAHELVRLC